MSGLRIDFITSLDGYAAGPAGGAWRARVPRLVGRPAKRTNVLMGANTYRLMSGLVADDEPGTEELAGLSKVVFSTT